LKRFFIGAFCQSKRTGSRIVRQEDNSLSVFPIPPGIDMDRWFPATEGNTRGSPCSFLYTGSPAAIRGFRLVLDAFQKIVPADARLKILARGGNSETYQRILQQVESRQLQDKVTISVGWTSPADLRQAIWDADAVLLPFVLVPSELPVTVMEVIACGRPVIVSDINGLPEAGKDCGLVVNQADVDGLAAAMASFCTNRDQLMKTFRLGYRRNRMLSWDKVAERWLGVLQGDANAI
jgi:glycosyltransferase involved in cell wall biosynthesis